MSNSGLSPEPGAARIVTATRIVSVPERTVHRSSNGPIGMLSNERRLVQDRKLPKRQASTDPVRDRDTLSTRIRE
jgi:hypothetical protein